MTIKEAKVVRRAGRSHRTALFEPGAQCANQPCLICAGYAHVVVEAAKSHLDRLRSCPQWLYEDIGNVSVYAGAISTHYVGPRLGFVRGPKE